MEDDNLELSDLVSFYPERNDENLQAIISAKKEFEELSSIKNESITGLQGDLYNHQKFFGRFIKYYDRGLVIDKPGTGKTCKVVVPMEWFQKNRGIIRKFFVIVPNKAVKHDVIKQIICFCDTGDRYKLPGLKKAKNISGQRASATKGLSRHYKVYTHGEFARFLLDTYPDALQVWTNQIIEYKSEEVRVESEEGIKIEKTKVFSGIAEQVLLDFNEWKTMGPRIKTRGGNTTRTKLKGKALENYILKKVREDSSRYKIKLTPDEIEKQANDNLATMIAEMSGAFYYLDEGHMLIPSEDPGDKDVLKQSRKPRYLDQFKRLFHSIKRSKIIITTATPMVNEPKDIRNLINLLRTPEEGLLPENFDYDGSSIEEVNKYFGGYITYVAPIDNRVDVNHEGEDIKHTINLKGGEYYSDTVKVTPLIMSEFQSYYYLERFMSEETEAFRNKALQASVFVFPDGSTGESGLKKYATRMRVKNIGESKEDSKSKSSQTASWFKLTKKDNFAENIKNNIG